MDNLGSYYYNSTSNGTESFLLDGPAWRGFADVDGRVVFAPRGGSDLGIGQPISRLQLKMARIREALNAANNQFTWRPPIPGAYSTYRIMGLHATLRLAFALIVGPIRSNRWIFEKAQGADDADLRMIRDMFDPQRRVIMTHSLNSVKYGMSPFEKVWTRMNDGTNSYWHLRLRPFFADGSLIWKDRYTGSYAGITPGWLVGRNKEEADGTKPYLDAGKSCLIVNEPEADDLYGYSRFDAAFDDWCDSMQLRLRRQQLDRKLAGTYVNGKYPPGSTMYGGVDTDNQQIMVDQVANLITNGAWLAPSLAYELDDDDEDGDGAGLKNDPELLAKLAQVSLWDLKVENAGNYAPAIEGFVTEEQYVDRRLFRAMERPERTGLEGVHGNKSDSIQHSDNSVSDSELIDSSVADQLNQQAVDDVLAANRGEKARGAILIRPPRIAPRNISYQIDLIKAAMQQNTPASIMFLKAIRLNKALLSYDFEMSEEGFNDSQLDKVLELAMQTMQNVQKPAGSSDAPAGNTDKTSSSSSNTAAK